MFSNILQMCFCSGTTSDLFFSGQIMLKGSFHLPKVNNPFFTNFVKNGAAQLECSLEIWNVFYWTSEPLYAVSLK